MATYQNHLPENLTRAQAETLIDWTDVTAEQWDVIHPMAVRIEKKMNEHTNETWDWAVAEATVRVMFKRTLLKTENNVIS